jgi:hypothetical protein
MSGIDMYEKPILFSLNTDYNVAEGADCNTGSIWTLTCGSGGEAKCSEYNIKYACAGGTSPGSTRICKSGITANYNCTNGTTVNNEKCCGTGTTPGDCSTGVGY